MAQQDRDVESHKIITAVDTEALEGVFRRIRSSLEQGIADGVDLDNLRWGLRRRVKSKKGKTKCVECAGEWVRVPHYLITSVCVTETDSTRLA
jgi:hypothetical protein